MQNFKVRKNVLVYKYYRQNTENPYHFKGSLLSISAGRILLFALLCWKLSSSSSSSSSSEMAMLKESTIRNISDLSIAFPSKLNSKLSLAFVETLAPALCFALELGRFFTGLLLPCSCLCCRNVDVSCTPHNSSSDFEIRVLLFVDNWIGCKKW